MSNDLLSTNVDELIERLRAEIAREEIATHNKIRELSARRDESRSDAAYDNWTDAMKQANREGYARTYDMRRMLDRVVTEKANLEAFAKVPTIIIGSDALTFSPPLRAKTEG